MHDGRPILLEQFVSNQSVSQKSALVHCDGLQHHLTVWAPSLPLCVYCPIPSTGSSPPPEHLLSHHASTLSDTPCHPHTCHMRSTLLCLPTAMVVGHTLGGNGPPRHILHLVLPLLCCCIHARSPMSVKPLAHCGGHRPRPESLGPLTPLLVDLSLAGHRKRPTSACWLPLPGSTLDTTLTPLLAAVHPDAPWTLH